MLQLLSKKGQVSTRLSEKLLRKMQTKSSKEFYATEKDPFLIITLI